jgi:hypothetical protein
MSRIPAAALTFVRQHPDQTDCTYLSRHHSFRLVGHPLYPWLRPGVSSEERLYLVTNAPLATSILATRPVFEHHESGILSEAPLRYQGEERR